MSPADAVMLVTWIPWAFAGSIIAAICGLALAARR